MFSFDGQAEQENLSVRGEHCFFSENSRQKAFGVLRIYENSCMV